MRYHTQMLKKKRDTFKKNKKRKRPKVETDEIDLPAPKAAKTLRRPRKPAVESRAPVYIQTYRSEAPISDTCWALRDFIISRPPVSHDINSFEFESSLLLVACRRASILKPDMQIDLPVCSNDRNCVGVTQRLRGFLGWEEGMPLMSYLCPREYSTLMNFGILPDKRRPCLLCYRYNLNYLIVALTQSGTPLHADIELASFYNDVGPGQYDPMYCHMPGEFSYIGVRRPCAAFRLDKLCVKQDVHGARYVCQEGMRHRQDFHRGTTTASSDVRQAVGGELLLGCPTFSSPFTTTELFPDHYGSLSPGAAGNNPPTPGSPEWPESFDWPASMPNWSSTQEGHDPPTS